MIFVTVGSQKFQFNRLLKKLDDLVENGTIKEKIVAQIGVSDYKPKNYEYVQYMDRDEFARRIDECDTVITHGGTGVIIGAVKKGKKVIAVPRLAKYGEHVDDHQLQLLEQFSELGIIFACNDIDQLGDYYRRLPETTFVPYVSNTQSIIDSIEEFLEGLDTKK